jgi:hypothetical protein
MATLIINQNKSILSRRRRNRESAEIQSNPGREGQILLAGSMFLCLYGCHILDGGRLTGKYARQREAMRSPPSSILMGATQSDRGVGPTSRLT